MNLFGAGQLWFAGSTSPEPRQPSQ
jgi:hypothetical protein